MVKRAAKSNRTRTPTAFEHKVYNVCKRIPSGRVTTYGDLAKALGSSPRAVGQALRRNPYAPAVPCHRVISASLQIGGFNGCWDDASPEVVRKRNMLQQEGVQFHPEHKVVDKKCCLTAPELVGMASPAATSDSVEV